MHLLPDAMIMCQPYIFLNFKIERQFGLMLGALIKIIVFQDHR